MKKLWFVYPAAVLIILLLFALQKSNTPTNEYEVIVFGDSIVGNDRTENSMPNIFAQISEMTVLNAGFGGTCMTGAKISTLQNEKWQLLSMKELARAYAKEDFSLQISILRNQDIMQPDYFTQSVKDVKNTDISKAEYIFIEHGVNDYLNAVTIENPDDQYDENTFAGSLYSIIKDLKVCAPDAKIVLMTPIYCYLYKEDVTGDCFVMDYGGGLLEAYVDKEIEIANELGIQIMDNFHESGIGPDNYSDYLWDGLHTNENGNRLLAERMMMVVEEENGD